MVMGKLFGRIAVYFTGFVVLSLLFTGIHGTIAAFLLLALVLSLANGLLRPILTFIALPFNLITFGIASVFVNVLMLLIACALVTAVVIKGFWLLVLASVVIMLMDSLLRVMRHKPSRGYAKV